MYSLSCCVLVIVVILLYSVLIPFFFITAFGENMGRKSIRNIIDKKVLAQLVTPASSTSRQ